MKKKWITAVLVTMLMLTVAIFMAGCGSTSYTITVINGTGGGSVISGEECTITATVPDGQEFVSWTDSSGDEVSTANPFTFTVLGDATLTATFKDVEAEKFAITIDDSIVNGDVECDYAKVTAGTEIELNVDPDSGYALSELKFNGTAITANSDDEYIFTMPSEDVTITATFVLIDYSVTIDSTITNGSVTADKTTVNKGDIITITVTPSRGYILTENSLKVNGTSLYLVGGKYTFTVGTTDVSITASFEIETFGVYVSGGTIGSDGATSGSFVLDEQITLTATTSVGKTFKGWYDITDSENSVLLSENSTYTYTVTGTAYIQAQYSDIEYTVSVDGGTVAGGSASAKYIYGDSVTITANAVDGKEFMYWIIDGDDDLIETDNPYSFSVTTDKTFTAVYQEAVPELDYDIFTVTTGGNSYCDGVYFAGDTVTVSLTDDTVDPNKVGVTAYEFYGWKDQNGNEYYTTSFEYENIQEDMTFTPLYKFIESDQYFFIDTNLQTLGVDRYLGGSGYSLFNESGNALYESVAGVKIYVYADVNGEEEVATFMFTREDNWFLFTSSDGKTSITGAPNWNNLTASAGSAGNVAGYGYFNIAPGGKAEYSSEGTNFLMFLMDAVENYDFDTTYYFGSQVIATEDGNGLDSDIAISSLGLCATTAMAKASTTTSYVSGVTGGTSIVKVTNGTGSAVYWNGVTATVSYEVPEGEEFAGWYDADNNLMSDQVTYSFTVTETIFLTAVSGISTPHSITVDNGITNGSVSVVDDLTEAYFGDTITLNITANDRYALVDGSVKVNGVALVANNGVYTYTMSVSDITITAEFEQVVFDITVGSLENGSIIVTDGLTSATIGDKVTFTVEASTDYMYVSGSFKINDVAVALDANNSYTYTMTAENITVTAEFTLIPTDTYTITIDNAITNGTISASVTEATYGTIITLTVTPDSDYALQSDSLKYGDTVIVASGGVYSFAMPASNITITAVFAVPSIEYTITVSGGTLAGGSTTATYESGDSVTITATDRLTDEPDSTNAYVIDGKDVDEAVMTFAGWFDENDNLVSSEAEFNLTVESALTLTAKYEFISTVGLAYVDKDGYFNVDRIGTLSNPDKSLMDDVLVVNSSKNQQGYSILDHEDVAYVMIYLYSDKAGTDLVLSVKYTQDASGSPILVYTYENGDTLTLTANGAWYSNVKGYAGFNANEVWTQVWSTGASVAVDDRDSQRLSVFMETILGESVIGNSYYVGSQIVSNNDAVLDGEIAIYTTYALTIATVNND